MLRSEGLASRGRRGGGTECSIKPSGRRTVSDRMVTPVHVCPFRLQSLDLVKRKGFRQHPRGGYGALQRHFHKSVSDPEATADQPILAVAAL